MCRSVKLGACCSAEVPGQACFYPLGNEVSSCVSGSLGVGHSGAVEGHLPSKSVKVLSRKVRNKEEQNEFQPFLDRGGAFMP